MPAYPPSSDDLRAAGKAALKRRRLLQKAQRSEVRGPIPKPAEHYHLVYTHPKWDTSTPNYSVRFETSSEAFRAVKELGDQAEPRTEWYDDGQVGIETRIPGLLGLHWMIISVGMCHRPTCVRTRPVIEILTKE